MEIRYTPTAEDSIHALRATSQPGWSVFLFVLLLSLMFLVGIYLLHHDLQVIGWVWLGLSATLGIAVYEVPQRQALRALRSNPSAQGEIVLTLDDKGMAASYPTGRSELEWRAYTRYKETDQVFLLNTGSRSSFIPKRAMSSDEVRELRALLNAKIRKQL